ncbi:MAG: hypothetical protein WC551_12730 [Patescibacteria group bacterium]
MSLFSPRSIFQSVFDLRAGLGRVMEVHPQTREVTLTDGATMDRIVRCRLVGPDLPPVYGKEEPTGKKPRASWCVYLWVGSLRKGFAFYAHSFDVDQEDVAEGYRTHHRIGMFRTTISGDGKTLVVEDDAGISVTISGGEVHVGSGAQPVARKTDPVKVTWAMTTGQQFNAAGVVPGIVTLTPAANFDITGEVTGGSSVLKSD